MNKQEISPPVVMVVGGMDPSGGAGLCADIQTLAAMGCHAAPVVTALTIQDTTAVEKFQLLEADLIQAQMQAVLNDMSISAVKTGMLGNSAIVSVIASVLKGRPDIPLIVDPVISSNKNDSLSEDSLTYSIIQLLLPIASLISPNIPEAALLAGKEASAPVDADECAALLYSPDSRCECMITGTHAETSAVINRYYRQGSMLRQWVWPRLQFEYHGSGCTLASAIAAGIAQGLDMEQALDHAQRFVINSLQSGFKPGHGQHLPNRMYALPELSRED